MEQEFILKWHGGFDKFEQAVMPAEERQFHIDRIQEEYKKQKESASKSAPKGNSPH